MTTTRDQSSSELLSSEGDHAASSSSDGGLRIVDAPISFPTKPQQPRYSTTTLELPSLAPEPILNTLYFPVSYPAKREIYVSSREDGAAYREGYVENGVGRCYGLTARLQRGVTISLNIDFEVNAINGEVFTTFKRDAQQYFSSDQWRYLEERHSGRARAGGWFAGAFGGLYARGNYEHYMNRRDSYRSSGAQHEEGFSRTTYSLDNSKLKVTGTIQATGLSYVPIEVTVYIRVTRITFANSRFLTAIDTADPVVADEQGRTSGVSTAPTSLNVVEI